MTSLTARDRLGIRLLGSCALVLLACGVIAAFVSRGNVALDTQTFCPPGQVLPAQTTILVDLTDPLPEELRQGLEARIVQIARFELQSHEFVTLWVLGHPQGMLRCVFARRYPGSDANPLFENPRQVTARCYSLFIAPLLEALRELPTSGASSSPILAALGEVMETARLSECRGDRRLLLVSDLLVNTPEFSVYRDHFGTGDYQMWTPGQVPKLDLQGVQVEVLQVSRPGRSLRADAKLRGIWREYLDVCGAQAVRFGRL